MQPITFYTHPHSRGRYVRWMLEECDASYDIVPVQFGAQMRSPEYLAINPMGKSPALQVGDTVLTETAAIITLLAEQFPEKNLIPATATLARGEYYRWMFFAIHAEYAMMDKWRGIGSDGRRSDSIGYGDFDRAIGTLTAFLKDREYALGTAFSALDVCLSGLIGWGAFVAKVLPVDGVLAAYAQRHTTRPACIKAQALDAALAREMNLA